MTVPTLTLDEVSKGIQDGTSTSQVKNVLVAILNDYMDLQYGKETPYTTGKQVVPSGTTIEEVDGAIAEKTTPSNYKEVFEKISETEKSGDLTPQSENDGTWNSDLKPVLVLVRPNK